MHLHNAIAQGNVYLLVVLAQYLLQVIRSSAASSH